MPADTSRRGFRWQDARIYSMTRSEKGAKARCEEDRRDITSRIFVVRNWETTKRKCPSQMASYALSS